MGCWSLFGNCTNFFISIPEWIIWAVVIFIALLILKYLNNKKQGGEK